MEQAKKGDNVKIHYTGKLDDGTEFDSSIDRDPLQFMLGEGLLIPGFEEAVEGMSPGEKKTIRIPAEEAYGPYIKELVADFDKGLLPPEMSPQLGEELKIEQEDGNIAMVRVIGLTDTTITLDANHPLAGKDLIFDISLVEISH